MSTSQLIIICAVIVLTGVGVGFGPGIYQRAYPSGPWAATWEECATIKFRFNFSAMDRCVSYANFRRSHDPEWQHPEILIRKHHRAEAARRQQASQ